MPSQVVVTAGAQHALVAALSGQLGPGDTLLVEELTYAGLLEAVRLLGIVPVAVAMDADGLRPDALDRVAQQTGARAVALQPVLHNPTGVAMPPARRRAIAEVVTRRGLHVIEDDIYGMLAPESPPLVTALSSPWSYVTSLSKSVVAGVRVGFLAVQGEGATRAARGIWATTVATSPLTTEIACGLIADGTADRIVAWKREEMRARQQLAREMCQVCQRPSIRPARMCGGRCRGPGVPVTSWAPHEAEGLCLAQRKAFWDSLAPRHAPCGCAWVRRPPARACSRRSRRCATSRRRRPRAPHSSDRPRVGDAPQMSRGALFRFHERAHRPNWPLRGRLQSACDLRASPTVRRCVLRSSVAACLASAMTC